MLLACKTPEELDISKLLAIYRSDSLENCRSMYPEEPTVEAALARYEAGYAAFMRSEFFARPGRLWMVETEDGLWASALRLLGAEHNVALMRRLTGQRSCAGPLALARGGAELA